MANTENMEQADSFEWDYLRCADLKYPVAADFQKMHVYRAGAVVTRNCPPEGLHALCVQLGLKKHIDAPGSRDIALLQNSGYLVEAVDDSAAFYTARTVYHRESSRRQAAFKQALFEREGLTDNPRAELCYDKAYERSHSKGLAEVANTFIDLAELIR